MTQAITPHTICLMRLLGNTKILEPFPGSRSRKNPPDEVTSFIIAEIETVDFSHLEGFLQKFFSLRVFRARLGRAVSSPKVLEAFDEDIAGMCEMHSMHKAIFESLALLHERAKDLIVDKSNMMDLFLKRCQVELKLLNFSGFSALYHNFACFKLGAEGGLDPARIGSFLPSHFRDRIARHFRHSIDEVVLRVDSFTNQVLPADFQDPGVVRDTRLGPYIEAMKQFQSGAFLKGNEALHDFFDDNIFIYFENPKIQTYLHSEHKKEEYKMAVEHTSLKRVVLSLLTFNLEAGSKLLEETMRWAQLNHHETEVQYCLLYKARAMGLLGDCKLHFTYVEDALVKALACNNYFLQVYSCIQHMGMDNLYDLKKLKKDIGQNRNLNSSMILNNAFGKLVMDGQSMRLPDLGYTDLYLLRGQILAQRRDHLVGLGLRKKNIFLDRCNPTALKAPPAISLTDLTHLEGLLDESVAQFNQEWQAYLEKRPENAKEYQMLFFNSYFQALILVRRRDIDTISTFYKNMERILAAFPEPVLVIRLWLLKVDLLVEKGCFEEAFCSAHFLLQSLEAKGYTKVLYLDVKFRVATIYAKTGKSIKAFEEINEGLSRAKENSLNDQYVQFKLLQVQVYLSLGFYSQCLTKLRKLSSAVMLSTRMNKLRHKETEIKVCLLLLKSKQVTDQQRIYQRVAQLVNAALESAFQLECLKSVKQLLFVKSKMHADLVQKDLRNRAAKAWACLLETEKFMKSHAHVFYSLDDSLQTASINRHFTKLIGQAVKQAVN